MEMGVGKQPIDEGGPWLIQKRSRAARRMQVPDCASTSQIQTEMQIVEKPNDVNQREESLMNLR